MRQCKQSATLRDTAVFTMCGPWHPCSSGYDAGLCAEGRQLGVFFHGGNHWVVVARIACTRDQSVVAFAIFRIRVGKEKWSHAVVETLTLRPPAVRLSQLSYETCAAQLLACGRLPWIELRSAWLSHLITE